MYGWAAAYGEYCVLYEGIVIMDSMTQYIMSILTASILCAIMNDLVAQKGVHSGLIKLITGILMSVTLISPLVRFEIGDLEGYFGWIASDAEAAAAYGENMARDSMGQVIKEQTEAYILDKADFWKLNLTVEVTLSETNPPVPCSVVLSGSASPYARRQLSQWISSELGIAEEQQVWK